MFDSPCHPDEIWRAVPGREDRYHCSTCGRIRSLDHVDCAGRRRKGRILRQNISGLYYMVTLYRDGEKHPVTVHGVILRTFAGEPPPGLEGCHGRAGTLDNHWPGNLCYGTHQRNSGADKERDGKLQRGEKMWMSKLTEVQVLEIRANPERLAQRDLAAIYQVDQTTISAIVTGRNWGWLHA